MRVARGALIDAVDFVTASANLSPLSVSGFMTDQRVSSAALYAVGSCGFGCVRKMNEAARRREGDRAANRQAFVSRLYAEALPV